MGLPCVSCDYWYFGASVPCLFAGGYYYQSAYLGLFYVSADSTSSAYGNVGSRLQELP